MSLFDDAAPDPRVATDESVLYRTDTLRAVLDCVLTNYLAVKLEPAAKHPFMNWFRRLGAVLSRIVPALAELRVEPAAGHSSNWSKNPYVNIRGSAASIERSNGVAVAYFFRDDMSAVYLAMYVASDALASGSQEGQSQVGRIRRLVEVPSRFRSSQMELGASNSVRKFESGYLFGLEYSAGNLPENETLVSDLLEMLEVYRNLESAQIREILSVPNISFLKTTGFRESSNDSYTFEMLLGDTLWTRADLEDVLAVVNPNGGVSRQVILAGPPGTGKTWVAKCVVKYLTQNDSNRSKLIQFHPSYSYEQFVEGLRPVVRDHGIEFEPVPGVVLRLTEAADGKLERYYLIMDELNRANLPRVLGELLYLFEYRNEAVDLAYTQGFKLPENVGFIGTMNTADHSLRGIDSALRRRFDIFETFPDPEILDRYYTKKENVNAVSDLVEGFTRLNDMLESLLDRHHTIGQSFFMAPHFTDETLRAVWVRQIFPTLEEYFFDQPDAVAKLAPERFWTLD